jgi:S1-C subfamily serine protease
MSREAQGPAAESDLHPGDLIVAVDGEALDGIDALHRYLSRVAPGTALQLKVVRRTQLLAIPLTVREPPA